MNYCIKELVQLSGSAAAIYCVHREGQDQSEFHQFLEKHKDLYRAEVKEITTRLQLMGKKEGAREIYFKRDEGLPGDLVCALYDQEESNLRLYCMRFGSTTIILGGGSDKPKSISAWQEKEDLKNAAQLMIQVSQDIYKRTLEKEIRLDPFSNRLIGNLKFGDYEN